MGLCRSSRRFGIAPLVAGLGLLLGVSAASAQPAFQVMDINTSLTGSTDKWPFASEFVELGSEVVFPVEDGVHGFELWISDGTEAGTRLLKDICPGARSSSPVWLTAAGSRVFFAADDCVHGRELWATDGTPGGTALVRDLASGLEDSNPADLTAFGASLVFSSFDPVEGGEIWITDGTSPGTVRLIGSALESRPIPWVALGGRLIFLAKDAASGEEVWTTDGTPAGTQILKDINPGASSATSGQFAYPGAMPFAVAGGLLFFGADDGTNGFELWTTDGTEAGTSLLADINPGPASSSLFYFAACGGAIYFSADDGAHGAELWKSDGTGAGTAMGKDIRPPDAFSNFGSNPRDLTAVGSLLYFMAQDGVHGIELWKSDGSETGTAMVEDIRPGAASGMFFFGLTLTALGGDLLFFADDGTHGVEPWKSDGTEAGTSLLADLNPGSAPSLFGLDLATADLRVVSGGRWYFRLYNGDFNAEVWTSDGTPGGTARLKAINSQTSAIDPYPFWIVPQSRPAADLGGSLVFQAGDGVGADLWKTDGTAAGTVPLGDFVPGPPAGFSQELTLLGGSVLFTVGDLFSTDGTPAGTGLLKDIPFGSFLTEMTRLGELVLFNRENRLWQSDGTDPGTTPLHETSLSNPQGLEPFGGAVLFNGEMPPHGQELWRSDGTSGGTFEVLDILPGSDSSSPNQITAAGSLALFSAYDDAAGRELWKTDGTPGGTARVRDIRPGPGDSMRLTWDHPDQSDERFAAVGGTVFFPADDGVAGEELWKSDGTAAGTVLVRDVFPGVRSSEIRWLTAASGRVYFVADDGAHGRELWVSDGTTAGTHLVRDLLTGSESSVPQSLFALGHVLLFSATDGTNGRELWRSNGVAAGTFQVQDIAPGPLSSTPIYFTPSGANLYFYANDNATGFELWTAPKADLLATFGDIPTTYWAWRFIEAIAARGVTAGCGGGNYCPLDTVTRGSMAVFLLLAKEGFGYVPPPCTTPTFADMPCSNPLAPWVEELVRRGVTAGCGGGSYCPDNPVTRNQMAVFLIKTLEGPAYIPPACTSDPFVDVPCSSPFAPWVKQMVDRGITAGCGGGSFCAAQPNNLAELAVFLSTTFNLPLP